MNNLDKITEYVRDKMAGEGSGHDFWHIQRVLNNAMNIQKSEGGDIEVIKLSCLLHDIGDYKVTGKHDTELSIPKEIMTKFEVSESFQTQVLNNIAQNSFRGQHQMPESLEGKITQDADRLDAIGAIGIARCFYYGGSIHKEMWNPEIAPRESFESAEQYMQHQNSSLNHFDEKLFKLKDLMNTQTAKKIADSRDQFLHKFYERFKKEWEGVL